MNKREIATGLAAQYAAEPQVIRISARPNCRHLRLNVVVGAMLALVSSLNAAQSFEEEFDDKNKPWEEIAVQLPAAPQAANLLPFYVGPTTTHTFSLDEKSLSVGKDGVVRYTLVAVSENGAKNVSYEGIRCASFARKIYALGQEDGTWTRTRRDHWEPVVRGKVNRQHAALALDYFCSNLTIAGSEKDMLTRVRSGSSLIDQLRN